MIFKNLFRPSPPKLPNNIGMKAEQTTDTDLLVIVGLGNPGPRYQTTRHNAGFLVLDFLRERLGFEAFREEKKFRAQVSAGHEGGVKLLLVKPETFMNESGKSVRAVLDFYKLSPKHLIVIHDDIDLEPGKMKVTDSSRSAGHNGVESIIETLGTENFRRIRLGIGRPTATLGACVPIHDYVLGNFSPEEKKMIESLFPQVESHLRLV